MGEVDFDGWLVGDCNHKHKHTVRFSTERFLEPAELLGNNVESVELSSCCCGVPAGIPCVASAMDSS